MKFFDRTIGQRVLFASLYFSEGAPIGYVWWALPTKLRAADVPIDQVTTLTALLTIPWTFKFAWAPLIDTLRGPRWGYRSWIIATQIGMGVALLPLTWIPVSDSLSLLTWLLVIHAIMAATQDVSVDAYCIATVHKSRRGDLNGWMQMGMLGGRAIFGGAVLYFERWWGEPMTIGLMIACIWSSTVLVALAGDQTLKAATSQSDQSRITAGFLAVLKSALRHRTTWFAFLFAASGAAAFEATGALAGPLLIDQGISQKTAGMFFAFPVVLCMGLGALIGGNLSDRLGRYRSIVLLAVLGVTITLTSAAVLAFAEPSDVIVILCLAVVYLMIGGFTSASYALFMDLTDPRLGATQFSAFMGATNLCEVWAVFTAGKIAQSSGYPTALALMACGSLVALLPLRWLYSCQRGETQ